MTVMNCSKRNKKSRTSWTAGMPQWSTASTSRGARRTVTWRTARTRWTAHSRRLTCTTTVSTPRQTWKRRQTTWRRSPTSTRKCGASSSTGWLRCTSNSNYFPKRSTSPFRPLTGSCPVPTCTGPSCSLSASPACWLPASKRKYSHQRSATSSTSPTKPTPPRKYWTWK